MSEFDKILGYENTKLELERLSDILKNPSKYKKLGVSIPSGIMLAGDPGLGKTLMAKCLIAEAGCKAYTLRKDKPNGSFVDEIRKTFDEAKSTTPSIVFLDDMDKFANEDDYHRNAEEYVTIQSCIDDCKGLGVFVIATVNEKHQLPDSLCRRGRFDRIIDIDVPEDEDSSKIIEFYLSNKKIEKKVDLEEISRIMAGNSCADIESMINEAGIYAGFENRKAIGRNDLIDAVLKHVYDSGECQVNEGDEADIGVLIHEAGHAVVSEVLDPGSVTMISAAKIAGNIGGFVKTKHIPARKRTVRTSEISIMRALGGKAATEVVLNVADFGCNSDMHKAYDNIYEIIDNVCAYGFESFERMDGSNFLSENKDRRAVSELDNYYREVKNILISNKPFLDAIVDALKEKRVLTYKDIEKIKTMVSIVA